MQSIYRYSKSSLKELSIPHKMADFIQKEEEEEEEEEERAEQLIHPVLPNHHHSQTPEPSQSFPLLRLPREIRDMIYSFALLHPSDVQYPEPTDPLDIFSLCPSARALTNHPEHCYWGTEKSTRLFFVSRQVSYEARVLFYSTFLLENSPFATIRSLGNSLRGYLSPWTRNLIKRVSITLSISVTPDCYFIRQEYDESEGIRTMLGMLPNIKWVTLRLWFFNGDGPEDQRENIVRKILKIMSPLRGFPDLNIELFLESYRPQQIPILKAVRERHDQYKLGPMASMSQ